MANVFFTSNFTIATHIITDIYNSFLNTAITNIFCTAEFWKVESHLKYYAQPINSDGVKTINWYDSIGWRIANTTHTYNGWKGVISDLMSATLGDIFIKDSVEGSNNVDIFWFETTDDKNFTLPRSAEIQLFTTLIYFKPYIDLINHWASKGYKPVQIK